MTALAVRPRRAYQQEERTLQQEIMLRLRSWPILVLPIPNGLWIPARTPEEKALVRRIIHQMKTLGMMVDGAFDLGLWWCGGGGIVEVKRAASVDLLGNKRRTGVLTPAQKKIAAMADAYGVPWASVHSWDEMHARLVEWRVPAL